MNCSAETSKRSSSITSDDLCCCEYIDLKGERNHLLASCCDCEILDDTCERILTRRQVPDTHFVQLRALINDRFRIPCFRGGAMKLNVDVVLPIVLLPAMILMAAQGFVWSVVSFTGVPLFCAYLHYRWLRAQPRTRFFVSWALATLVLLEGVMEVEVLPFLDILPSENFILKCFMFAMLFCVYLVYRDPGVIEKEAFQTQFKEADVDAEDMRRCQACGVPQYGRAGHCRICNVCILRRDHHCVWIDTCIGARNHRAFVFGLIFVILSLGYGCHLTLTTICQPVLVFDTFLVPNDCRGVYENIHLALCFVSAIYALMILFAATVFLFFQLWLISHNMTIPERWQAKQKGQWGSTHSRGILRNCYNFWRGPR